jgi:hypothetical protein
MARSNHSKTLRSSPTPPSVNSIGVREFVRGAIYDLDQPTVVMSRSTELGTWYPRGQGASVFYAGTTTTPPLSDNVSSTATSSFASSLGSSARSFSGPAISSTGLDIQALHEHVKSIEKYLKQAIEGHDETEGSNG